VIKEDIINDNDSAFEDAEEEVIQKPKNLQCSINRFLKKDISNKRPDFESTTPNSKHMNNKQSPQLIDVSKKINHEHSYQQPNKREDKYFRKELEKK